MCVQNQIIVGITSFNDFSASSSYLSFFFLCQSLCTMMIIFQKLMKNALIKKNFVIIF